MKKILLIISLLSMPINAFAYSEYVILGGQTIGIDVESTGVMIVGFYKINGTYNTTNPQIIEGDYIISVNGENVDNIENLSEILNKYSNDESVTLLVKRNEKEFEVSLNLVKDNNTYKTGIYVKDSITGIGTLTFIDPATNVYGALGHEIIESSTSSILDISGGTIFENTITSITKSEIGSAGSKNASFFYENTYGTIINNTTKGIYGNYTDDIEDFDLIKVGNSDDVEVGPAIIYTVTEDQEVETYDIYIRSINENSDTKNLYIEITDEELLNITGGVVQGMSGSPIIQNDTLVGAVTHVLTENPATGYGIYIENMLEISDSLS